MLGSDAVDVIDDDESPSAAKKEKEMIHPLVQRLCVKRVRFSFSSIFSLEGVSLHFPFCLFFIISLSWTVVLFTAWMIHG
jgi:hypothetical protein